MESRRTHNDTDFAWRNPRSALVIESTGDGQLGNCYSSMTYKVTSRQPLTKDKLVALRELGFLGYGQEFFCYLLTPSLRQLTIAESGTQDPSGHDIVPCSMIDRGNGKIIPGPAINPYSGLPYPDHQDPYYIYICESRVDSSD